MSRIEQAGYPYVKGSHGIPLNHLDYGRVGRKVITGGSGRELAVVNREVQGELEFRVWDMSLQDDYYLIAHTVAPETIIFNLKTAGPINEANRHPDMFAASFVDFAFQNFEQYGKEIKTWRAGWSVRSLNYGQYRELRGQGLDVPVAAIGTWTGNMAARHGFVFDSSSEWFMDSPHRVMVEFTR